MRFFIASISVFLIGIGIYYFLHIKPVEANNLSPFIKDDDLDEISGMVFSKKIKI